MVFFSILQLQAAAAFFCTGSTSQLFSSQLQPLHLVSDLNPSLSIASSTALAIDDKVARARTRALVHVSQLSGHDLAPPIRTKNYRLVVSGDPMELQRAGMQDAGGGVEDGVDDVFFCVAATSRGNRSNISFFHTNAAGEDAQSALALAALCLDHAPEHHRWHHHTVGGARTFAFLSAGDGRTYFAAADPTPGAAEALRFLERVRDACDAAPRKRLRNEAVAPVARQFTQLLRAIVAGSGAVDAAALPGDSPRVGLPPTPLAPVCAEDAGVEKDEEHQRVGAQRRAVQPGQESPRRWWRSWWRHAMVVIGVDVVVCLVLFAVWMGVCKGFRCLT